jgi:hypothetical protein
VLRRRRRPADDPLAHVDPRLVAPRLAPAVTEALATRARFGEVVAGVAEGPVQDRLAEAGARIDAAVLAVWEVGRRAGEIEGTATALDTAERLRALDARLGAAVAKAAEIALGTGGVAEAEAVEQELDDVVTELDALRVALRALG